VCRVIHCNVAACGIVTAWRGRAISVEERSYERWYEHVTPRRESRSNPHTRDRARHSDGTPVARERRVDPLSTAVLTLDRETRGEHARADDGWLRLCRYGVTTTDYIDQLIITYGFESPLESAIAYTPGMPKLLDLRARARAGFIAQDLLALGLSPSAISRLPQCALAPFASAVEALGWLYVVERATHHHEVVRRHLARQLPDVADACAYLSCAGGNAVVRWAQFGAVVESAVTSAQLPALIAAANTGFRTYAQWCEGALAGQARGA
jgi:heme oxygenase